MSRHINWVGVRKQTTGRGVRGNGIEGRYARDEEEALQILKNQKAAAAKQKQVGTAPPIKLAELPFQTRRILVKGEWL